MTTSATEPLPKGRPTDLRRLLACGRPYWRRLAVALASLLASTVLALAMPQTIRLLIDAAFSQHDAIRVNRAAFLLFGVFAGQGFFAFWRSYLFSYVGEKVVADLRVHLFETITGLSLSFFASRRVGEITSRLTSDVGMVQNLITGTLGELVRQVLTLAGGIVIVAVTNPRLTLVMFAITPLVVGGAWLYGAYLRRISTRVQDALASAGATMNECFAAIHIVQSFGREPFERQRYGKKVDEALRLAIRRSLAIGGFNGFFIVSVMGGMAIVIWYGSRLVATGEMTAGDLSAFVMYLLVLAFSIGGIGELYGSVQSALGSSRRVFELLEMRSEIRDPEYPRSLHVVKGHVRFQNVTFEYASTESRHVLDDVTIEVQPGEVVALVGPSGAGKSTLASLIPRFYDASAGAVIIDSIDVRDLKVSDLRQAVAIVPQETILFSGSIRDNIAYGRLDATSAEIEAAARSAHAHSFIMECPEAYETQVGERGVKLSGGQRQRIAIARALLKKPSILILDEATSALDSESERLVQDALDTLILNRTTFVIAHRLSTVRRAHKIVVLNEGRVVEQGTHAELLGLSGMYKYLHDLQFHDDRADGGSADPRLVTAC